MKFNKKRIMTLTTIISLTLAMVSTSVKADEVVNLKVGNGSPASFHINTAWNKFKKEVEKNSNNKMRVDIFPAGQLGDDRELIEFVQMGELDLSSPSLATLSPWDSAFSVVDLPYQFSDKDIARKVLFGDFGEFLGNRMEKIGLKKVGWFELGVRELTNSQGPMYSPKDVEGLKIRTMPVEAHIMAWKQLGANPVPMASSEVFSALQQKVIDAQENPLSNIKAMRTYEVNKYITMTNHVYSAAVIIMNPEKFNSLTNEQKRIVTDAIAVASDYQQEVIKKEEQELVSWYKKQGVEINELTPDQMSVFQSEIKKLDSQYKELVGVDVFNKLQDSIQEISGNL